MKARDITIWSILGTLISLLCLEIWTLANNQEDDTISEVVQSAAHKWVVIPFLTGFLMGHWFWPLDTRRKDNVSK